MKVVFLPEAAAELREAMDYLDAQTAGLGERFRLRVAEAVQSISDWPDAHPPLGRGFRRCRVRRFEYGLIYEVIRDVALVHAVMHLKRKPGYWRGRR